MMECIPDQDLQELKDALCFDGDDEDDQPECLRISLRDGPLAVPPASNPDEREKLLDDVRNAILSGDFNISSANQDDELDPLNASIAKANLSNPEMADHLVGALRKIFDEIDEDEMFDDDEYDGDDYPKDWTMPIAPEVLKVLPNDDIAELLASTVAAHNPGFDVAESLREALDSGMAPDSLAWVLESWTRIIDSAEYKSLADTLPKKGKKPKPKAGSKTKLGVKLTPVSTAKAAAAPIAKAATKPTAASKTKAAEPKAASKAKPAPPKAASKPKAGAKPKA